MTNTPTLTFPNFNYILKIYCNASNVGNGIILSQNGHQIDYFNEKLNEA